MFEEPTQEELYHDEIRVCQDNWERNVDKILAEYASYLRKHRLISQDGQELNHQLQNITENRTHLDPSKQWTLETVASDWKSIESGIPFKIELLKMLINFGEEDLQDELDALEGKLGDKLIDEEIAKQKRLAKRLSKLVEVEIEAKRQLYTDSVKQFKEEEIKILSLVEIGKFTQEEAAKKLEEVRRQAEQDIKNISNRS